MTRTPALRPTRVPGGQVVTAAGVPASAATVRIEAQICVGSVSDFVLADDLDSGSLGERPEGCRPATASEVTVRAETLSPDGFLVTIATADSDESGAVSFTIPTGQNPTVVRLTAISPVTGATTTVTLAPGQTQSLTMVISTAEPVANRMTTGWSAGDGAALAAAGGPELVRASPTSRTGWVAVAGLLLAALAVAFPAWRRTHRQ